MNTDHNRADSTLTPAAIDAIIRKARADRAEVMREQLGELGASFRRLVATFRPIRARTPHKGVWA